MFLIPFVLKVVVIFFFFCRNIFGFNLFCINFGSNFLINLIVAEEFCREHGWVFYIMLPATGVVSLSLYTHTQHDLRSTNTHTSTFRLCDLCRRGFFTPVMIEIFYFSSC